ncbi:YesL family protein [Bifidobacterium oedipodis]|uniref:DUF624 domain-containing protein n=1 Tax=Bifidobacterium oedipodis TaxID=2675322 RepID=A0A7Y0EPM6_9BIFI|nr:DUF624 domain-containing protein [Bifidobacterium sp. DSM 109957]NMM94116.1 hypothetical protein [Bifidobacterium sp. DSM 109957]
MAMNMKQRAAQSIYNICLLICRLVMMNLLWIAYTLLGLVVFGIVPATITVVEVFRAYEREGDAFAWAKRSWQYYKANIKRFWLLSAGFSLVMVSGVLSWQVLEFQSNPFAWVLLIVLVYLFGLVLPFAAANEANFDITRLALVKNSLQLPLMWPLTSLKILAVEVAVTAICWMVPGLLPIFAVSVPLFLASAFLTVRWNKQLKSIGSPLLPIAAEQDRNQGGSVATM